MKNTNRMVGAGVGMAAMAAAGLFWGCAGQPMRGGQSQAAGSRSDGPDWANRSTNMIIDKYGPPDRVETNRVVWENKGPWKRIVVWDDMGVTLGSGAIAFSMMNKGGDRNLEEVLAYLVPEDKRRAVEEFSGRIKVSDDGALLSARSFSEERNFLALNLADEIIRGVKTPEEAKAFDSATLKLADAGESSPYLKGLMFRPPLVPSSPEMMTSDGAQTPPGSGR
jgi:hypothetical protein